MHSFIKLLYQASLGYADSTRTRQLSSESRFYIGSIDKEFSGAGLLLLQQPGKLKLADKVSQYLADYAWANAVQVGQLINTSGLPELPDLPYGGIHDWLMKLPALAVKPGLAYIYSYADVYLQQKIIEKITGLDYRQFVISRLLRPCGISDVRADTARNDPRTALPFSNSFKPVDLTSSMSPGMMFTAFDLFHWMDCLSTNQLLNASSLEVIGTSFGGGESNLGSAAVENGRLSRHQHQGSGYNYEALVFSERLKQTLRTKMPKASLTE